MHKTLPVIQDPLMPNQQSFKTLKYPVQQPNSVWFLSQPQVKAEMSLNGFSQDI